MLWDPLLQPPSAKRHMPPACGLLCSKNVSSLHGLGSCNGSTTLPGRNCAICQLSVVSTQNTRRPRKRATSRSGSVLVEFPTLRAAPHRREGHEGVPLFSSLTLVDGVHPAVIVLPEISGWRRIKQTYKRENGTSSQPSPNLGALPVGTWSRKH